MTDAPTAEASAPAEPPQETPPAAPAPAQVPASPAPSEMVSIPADRMESAGYGTDWHNMMADAKYGKEARENGLFEVGQRLSAEGMTPREYLAFLDNYPSQQPPAAQEPASQPEPPTPTVLTEDRMREILREERESDRKAGSERELRQAETAHREKVLDDAKLVVGEDGKGAKRRSGAKAIYDNALVEVLLSRLPSYASDEARAKAARAPATEADLAEASKLFGEIWADLGNEAVADAANNQEEVPGETLSGGPGGQEPPKNFEDMSYKEQKAKVLAAVDGLDEEK